MAGPDFLGLGGLAEADRQRREAQDAERRELVHGYAQLVFGGWAAKAALKASEAVVQEQFGPESIENTIGPRQYELMQANWQVALSLVDTDRFSFESLDYVAEPMLQAEPGATTRHFTEGGTQYRAEISGSFVPRNLQAVLYAAQQSVEDTPGVYNSYGWFRTDIKPALGESDTPNIFPLIPQDAGSNTAEKYDVTSSVANAKQRISDPALSTLTNVLVAVSQADSAMGKDASTRRYAVPSPRLPLESVLPPQYMKQLDSFRKRLSAAAFRAVGFGDHYRAARSVLADLETEVFNSKLSQRSMEIDMGYIRHTYPKTKYPRKRDIVAEDYGPKIEDVHAGAAKSVQTMVEPLAQKYLVPLLVGDIVESNLRNSALLHKILHDADREN